MEWWERQIASLAFLLVPTARPQSLEIMGLHYSPHRGASEANNVYHLIPPRWRLRCNHATMLRAVLCTRYEANYYSPRLLQCVPRKKPLPKSRCFPGRLLPRGGWASACHVTFPSLLSNSPVNLSTSASYTVSFSASKHVVEFKSHIGRV